MLLARVQRGDEQAMADLFDRYSKIVYSIALRILRETASADDVLQETFMQLWLHPCNFVSARASLGCSLAVVTRNRCIATLRRRKPTDEVEGLAPASSINLADETERNFLMERARAAILLLPAEQRKTLEMAVFGGWTHYEIAEMTGDPLGTVKARIRNGLLTLRQALQT